MDMFKIFKKENPEKGKEHFNVATEQLGKENWEETFKNISESISYDSSNPFAYFVRALCFVYFFKNYDSALKDLNKAIGLKEADRFYIERGKLYKTIEKFSEALLDLNKAIKLNTNLSEAYSLCGSIYWEYKNYNEAINNWNKFIELEPDNAKGYSFRGYNRALLQEYELALIDIKKAISLESDNSLYYFHLATTYMLMLNLDEARRFFQKSYELGDEGALTLLESIQNRSFIKFGEIEATTLPTVNEDEAKLFLSHLSPNDGFMFEGIEKPKASLFYSLKYAFPRHCFGDAYLLSIDVSEFKELCRSSLCSSLEPILQGKVLGRMHLEFGGGLDDLKIEVKPM